MFTWCLIALYGEQESVFSWKDFKKKAFEVDKGKDFTERVKGLKSKLPNEHFNYANDKIFLYNLNMNAIIIAATYLQSVCV